MNPDPAPPLTRTPTLERLLRATRAAIVRQVLAYGLGTVLGAATLWLAFAFLADWGLRVPHAIRIFHGLMLAAVITVFLWRDLLRPLRMLPTQEGLALLFERVHPQLAELLISALQFQRRAMPNAAEAPLVDAVVAAAEARAGTLSPRSVVDPEAPRARLLLGLGGVLGLAALAWSNPLLARTFVERLFGGTASWPQRTNLVLDLPGIEPQAVVARSRELWRLRLARGTDVALLVTAEGELPSEVVLHFEGGSDIPLSPSGGNAFRTLLRSVQQDLAFHFTGGDDEDGLPRVEVEVLEPPDVEGLAIAVEAPAYAGLASALYFNQDVEVLSGSRVKVHVLAAPRTARGQVHFLPGEGTQELAPAPFPLAPGATTASETGLAFECVAEKTLGFRVELSDENGLSNPEPGLYRIRVSEDRAPELTVLAPGRSEFESVRGGALPLRVRAEDDYGLASLGWRLRRAEGGSDESWAQQNELALQRPAVPTPNARGKARDTALGSARLELDALGTPEAPLAVDSRFELEFFARDQRSSPASEGRSTPVRIRVVTPEELLRRLQDRLASARMDALRLSDEQRAKRARIEELLDAQDGDDPLGTGDTLALSAALAGERRVLSDAQALARALANAAEDVLYARLDEKAAPLLEFYDARAATSLDARFQAAPWRALAAECAAGRFSDQGFAATLVKLVELALSISEDEASAAVAALDAAEKATARSAVADALAGAVEHSQAVEKRIEVLLGELAEWDNFQNVLTLARDILERQKSLRDRTQEFTRDRK
ncbi:MAG: hypothetical protein EXS08_07525 [Planctomycetes bacterium]|nr:hypothetical protein [Planctomycetota bacterium]